MTRRTLQTTAVAGALALVLTACTPNDSPSPSASPSGPGSPTPSVSTSAPPTSTLAPAEQEAFEQAVDVVVGYRQTITDLYTGARTKVNDLNDVLAAGDLLDRELQNVSQGLSQGYSSEPAGAQIVLVSAEAVRVNVHRSSPTVVVRACVDASGITDVAPDGSRTPGVREQLDYTVIKTDYLPKPGWAILKVAGEPESEDRAC